VGSFRIFFLGQAPFFRSSQSAQSAYTAAMSEASMLMINLGADRSERRKGAIGRIDGSASHLGVLQPQVSTGLQQQAIQSGESRGKLHPQRVAMIMGPSPGTGRGPVNLYSG
jgi:hypothetical protein